MTFSGGALLSAVALMLPEGIANIEPANQLAVMPSDFVPESIALGAAFATGSNQAFLLAA